MNSATVHAPRSEKLRASPLLDVRDVTVRFGGIVALDGVSFDVGQGQICGLIGPNGAGKSTLFNCLSRIYRYSAGGITFDGQALDGLPDYRMAHVGIGRTFQNLALFGTLSVLENIQLGCHSRHHAGFVRSALRTPSVRRMESAVRRRAQFLLEYLALDEVASRRVMDLPFAIQKRVELARALAGGPKLLLLDEPACGLNHEELESLSATIRDIRSSTGTAILLVEHHMGLVMGICDKVVALNFGRKIAEGAPSDVSKEPAVIEAYLGGPSE